MITLTILAIVCGILLIVGCCMGVVLLDPIIAIFSIYGVYKLIAVLLGKFIK